MLCSIVRFERLLDRVSSYLSVIGPLEPTSTFTSSVFGETMAEKHRW